MADRRTCRSYVVERAVIMIDAPRLAVTGDVTSAAVVAGDAGGTSVALRSSHDRHHRSRQQSAILRRRTTNMSYNLPDA